MNWIDFILQILICGVSVGIAVIIFKYDKRHSKDLKTINALADEVCAYWHLEKEYAKDLSARLGTTQKKIVIEFRDKTFENHDCKRPCMTATEAMKLKR